MKRFTVGDDVFEVDHSTTGKVVLAVRFDEWALDPADADAMADALHNAAAVARYHLSAKRGADLPSLAEPRDE